jgi:hypothetical protein
MTITGGENFPSSTPSPEPYLHDNRLLSGGDDMRGICWVAVALFMTLCVRAEAAFVDGVEEFNGTSVDETTWVRHYWGNGAATVSNGYLDFTGQYQLATKSLTLGVGDTLSARVMLKARSSSGTSVELGLTDTPTDPRSGWWAMVDLSNTIQGESNFHFFTGGNNVSYGDTAFVMSNNVGSWYRLRLRRNSVSNYTIDLLTDSESLIHSTNRTFAGLPDRTYAFIGLGPTASFDWVAVPEPTAIAALACGGVLLLSRRPLRWPRNISR